MKAYQITGHAPSFLPSEKNWKLIWADEFDGTALDTDKWGFRTKFWGHDFQTFTTQGVELDGSSNLKIHLLEQDGQYYSAQLQTGANTFDSLRKPKTNPWGETSFWPLAPLEKPKFMHKYGYYEIRCKLPKQPGWWCAFWLQAPGIGTTYDPAKSGVEVDIMENFSRDGEVTSGNIFGGYGENYQSEARVRYHVEETEDGYHYFGVDWSKDGYTFYCDGKQTAHSDGPVSEVEQFILVTTECKGYRKGDYKTPSEELKQAVLPDCFTVDFVRVFDQVE